MKMIIESNNTSSSKDKSIGFFENTMEEVSLNDTDMLFLIKNINFIIPTSSDEEVLSKKSTFKDIILTLLKYKEKILENNGFHIFISNNSFKSYILNQYLERIGVDKDYIKKLSTEFDIVLENYELDEALSKTNLGVEEIIPNEL